MAENFSKFDGKFGRKYVLRIEISDNEFVEVKDPITCEFSIVRNNLASANTATFTLFNLNPDNRNKIYKDQYDMGTFRAIQFYAGYGSQAKKVNEDESETIILPQLFNGAIKKASSQREGAEFKTEIECYDGAVNVATATVSQTQPPGSTRKALINGLIESLTGINSKTIGAGFEDASKRGVSLMGNPMDLLQQFSGNTFYIDSQNAYALGPEEVIPSDIRLISAENGLLGTPRKYETLVELDMLFEPRLKPSQAIELKSVTDARFNGVYKLVGLTHRGTISGSIGGDCKTSVQLLEIKNAKVVFDSATSEYRIVQ